MGEEEKKIKGKIQAVSEPREYQGKLQIGFMIEKKWYNMDGKLEELEDLLNNFIKKGNVVEFNFEEGKILDLTVVSEAEEEGSWQEDIIDFKTLLNDAHKNGLKEIKTEMISVDFEKKIAVFKAIAIGKKGTYEAHGDATADNVGDLIKLHFMRMSETRAICRCLRWYTNNATCAEEEKGKTKKTKEIKKEINK